MKRVLAELRAWIRDRFNLDDDKADEQEIVNSIKRSVEFKGSNLWALIFAILIASIGLNVNSAAVIIGAMLISPLMGPIMGVGLGVGINDLALVRSGLKNLLIAAFFSILTSSIYFWITPLDQAQSEILARTTPSLWDVFIAFFGGLAGIVAGTRKEKSNVIPGVAIATALMPPLCTAGFGLGSGNLYYFAGALYLFFINCVFICISTFLIVRYLKFQKVQFGDIRRERRVRKTILWVVILTVLPSIYMAYRIVDQSIYETNAKRFVEQEFRFARTQVVNESYLEKDGKRQINLLLIGEELPEHEIDTIRTRLANYGLTNTDLFIRQGLTAKQEIDFSTIKASILQDVFRKVDSVESGAQEKEGNIKPELLALFPKLMRYSVTNALIYATDTTYVDTVTIGFFKFQDGSTSEDRDSSQLANWLRIKMNTDSVRVFIE